MDFYQIRAVRNASVFLFGVAADDEHHAVVKAADILGQNSKWNIMATLIPPPRYRGGN